MKIITAVTVAMAGSLVLLNRVYLQPFDSATGQCVLLLVFACFGGAVVGWLVQMSPRGPRAIPGRPGPR